MFEYGKQMRLHLLHFAKFAALVALAVVITHTLGSHATGTHERARPAARAAERRVRLDTGGNLLVRRTVDAVATETAAGTAMENKPYSAEAALRLAGGDAAEQKTAAGADGGIISNLAEELKSTITLLRAYSQWIRTSPDPIS